MAGAGRAFEPLGEGADDDDRVKAFGIDFFGRRREQEVYADAFGHLGVALRVARIAVEVVQIVELGRVDE